MPKSTVIESEEGVLLGAKIAADGQWRFPKIDTVPPKFETCILQFEDAYFYKHLGFNPISMAKALVHNAKGTGFKRGASTITQQVIRLSRQGKQRTYLEKLKELILATRLELACSKKEILELYTSYAPFGGNVVGLEAASWRYYGRSSKYLSWAENATLAVLPNAPSLIFPGKNKDKLLAKRNRLLRKLYAHKIIDSLTFELALLEKLPSKPHPLPAVAPHFLETIAVKNSGERVRTTISHPLQENVNAIVKRHYLNYKQNEVYNMAVLVLDVKTRKVLAYVGNTPTDKSHQSDVDIVRKARSTGSVLKPYLYAAMLHAGELLPKTLVPDVPTEIASYNPKNFSLQYDGAVPADVALSRSLNVPAVKMLQKFGLPKFYETLQKMDLTDVKYPTDHYGLTLILGGAESNLWDLTKAYAALSSTLNNFLKTGGNYYENEFVSPVYKAGVAANLGKTIKQPPVFGAASIYLTYKALKEVNRPEGEENWEFFDSTKEIAWKTGTSFGFRDAWAIGSTKDHVVGVWVGNADGEGRPGLLGVQSAGPVMFDVFDVLPRSSWFQEPYSDLEMAVVCRQSGSLATAICPDKDTLMVPQKGLETQSCSYHKLVHLNADETAQVNSSCIKISEMKHQTWFVLPPLMEYYFKQKNPFYKPLPPFAKNCSSASQSIMDFVYPTNKSKIFLPKGFDGVQNPLVVKLTHSTMDTEVYWYLDAVYIGKTTSIHEISINATVGKHVITVLDELGNEKKLLVEILE